MNGTVGENCFCQAEARKRTLRYVRRRSDGKSHLQARPVLKCNDYKGYLMPRALLPLLFLSTFYGSLLVVTNAIGAKLIEVGPFVASATVFVYAFSFLITDVVSEVYGKKAASMFVWYGFATVIIAVILFQLALWAPSASFFESQKSYEDVFSSSWRVLLGGLTAYIVSQIYDVWIFHKVKKATKGKHLWLRNNVSTIGSQFIDTLIFITIAFYGTVPNIMELIIGQYVIKLIIAILDTPLIYMAVAFLRNWHDHTPETVGEEIQLGVT